MNGLSSQDWLNALLVLIHHVQLALLRLWHALGLREDSHGQASWPWAHRVVGETLLIDLGLARQVAWSLVAVASAGIALALALPWRRRRPVLLAFAALALSVAPWPAASLVFGPAVPTSFHISPTRFSVDSIARGARIYTQNCAACHGKDGRGEGPLAATLTRWPPTLVSQLLARRADGEMFWRIQHGMRDEEGHSTMPAFSARLGDADTWAVLDYLKALAAGTGASVYGDWPLPLALPDVTVRCGREAARPLAQWRAGQRVRVVAFDGNPVSIPLDDVRFKTLLVTRDGEVPPGVPRSRTDCTAAAVQAWSVFARIAGVPETAFGGTQLLADRSGWLRAKGTGKKVWSDADMLCKSGQPATASGGTTEGGLEAVLRRMDAEPVRFVKGGFMH